MKKTILSSISLLVLSLAWTAPAGAMSINSGMLCNAAKNPQRPRTVGVQVCLDSSHNQNYWAATLLQYSKNPENSVVIDLGAITLERCNGDHRNCRVIAASHDARFDNEVEMSMHTGLVSSPNFSYRACGHMQDSTGWRLTLCSPYSSPPSPKNWQY